MKKFFFKIVLYLFLNSVLVYQKIQYIYIEFFIYNNFLLIYIILIKNTRQFFKKN